LGKIFVKFVCGRRDITMNKKGIDTTKNEDLTFPRFKSYSVEEVLAAGGTTAFAEKLGKDPRKIMEKLKKLPKESFLTDEEVEAALKILNEGK
jgi:hypothetical protein